MQNTLKQTYKWILFYPLLIGLISCVPYEENVLKDINIDLSKPSIQKVFNAQDAQVKDSLIHYLGSPDPSLRLIAARAFGSVQDTTVIDTLGGILQKDPVEAVREAAAFALGQIGRPAAIPYLTKAFSSDDSTRTHTQLNALILEAVGKSGSEKALKLLATAQHYQPKDSALLEGLAKGIYRFGYRGISSPQGTERMAGFLQTEKYARSIRFWAAHYFFRTQNINLDSVSANLITAFFQEPDPGIRMALALGLGKLSPELVADTLIYQLEKETDWRVKCNIIRAMPSELYEQVKLPIITALSDPNHLVQVSAAEWLLQHGTADDASDYRVLARQATNWRVKALLLKACLTHVPIYFEQTRSAAQANLYQMFRSATSPYPKMAALDGFTPYPWNYKSLYNLGMSDTATIVQAKTIECLGQITSREDFDGFFRSSAKRVKSDLSEMLLQAFFSKDAAAIYYAAEAINNASFSFKSYFENPDTLLQVKSSLVLPRETETLYALEKAIAKLKGNDQPESQAPTYNHPIDWRVLKAVSAESRALIKTGKGEIECSFYWQEAPGTVANFVLLARDGFFNGKKFHRVVPNFVAQGACPRGDGFGSLDYSIRSELSPVSYSGAGCIGMASAGLHTEGVQFFITHSATPHLDGRYSIFAQVTKGQDVVDKLEVGDAILEVIVQ